MIISLAITCSRLHSLARYVLLPARTRAADESPDKPTPLFNPDDPGASLEARARVPPSRIIHSAAETPALCREALGTFSWFAHTHGKFHTTASSRLANLTASSFATSLSTLSTYSAILNFRLHPA